MFQFISFETLALEQVTLQLKWKHQFQFGGFYAAQKMGYFEAEGLDVKINEVNFTRSTSEIVLGGDADFGISDSSLILSRLKGNPVVIVAAIYQHSPLVLLTLKSSNIISPLELHGKKVMYQKNIDDAVLTAMFTELNLKDTDHIHVPHTFQDDALIKGKVDAMSAYITNQPFFFREKNVDLNIISPSSYGIDFYGDMIFVTEDYLINNKEKVLAFKRASIKGWKYALNNSEEISDWILSNYKTEKSKEHLLYEAEHIARMIQPDSIDLGHFSTNRLKKISDIYKNLGLAPKDKDISGISYTDYFNGTQNNLLTKTIIASSIGLILFAAVFLVINHRLKKLVEVKTRQYKDSQSKLQNSEELLRGLFELSPVGIALNDLETGAFIKINKALVAPTGYTIDEFIKLSYWDITPKDYQPIEAKQLDSLMKNNKYGPYEKEYIKKNGERYPVLLNGIIVNDPSTNKKMIWSIVEDITERNRVQNDLIDAKDKAVIAANAKSDFLASMSHEIRTPMNGVIGMLDLLKDSDLTNEQAHRLKLAHFSAKSLLTLINDILDYSKVDAGKLDLENIDFDIRELLGNVSELMAQLAQDKNLEVILDTVNIKHPFVKGDPSRIRQVLTNIIGNAIKFTHHGEIIIRATTDEIDETRLSFNCSIIDTGIGIAKEFQDDLFNSFTQVDTSTTRKYGGTGLGLAISSRLCKLMQGDIKVKSTEGEGSCFDFSIIIEKSSRPEITVPDIDISTLNILIVDNNTTSRNVLKSQLERWGANISVSTDAESALEFCQTTNTLRPDNAFDIAFIDSNLPGMSGAEFAKKLQLDSRFKTIKLIMMTSFTALGDAKALAEIGFRAYFPKPVTTSDLLNALSIISEDGEALKKAAPLVTRHYLNDIADESRSRNNKNSWPDNTRILLVEDNHVNQLVAKGILETLGLTPDITNDGLEAIKALKESKDRKYSCILMDCQMPNMDGYQATKEIRNGMAGDQYKQIPIIAMTANAMQGDKEKCLNSGMDDYLSKPIDNEKLIKKLNIYLNN
ncbi:MAG: ABC transporter substrate-binding protein [Gammaproteobacteria bacterium]|nr:ABC transporter substrate-binding protein [Gammaproteobacteria bacterium]